MYCSVIDIEIQPGKFEQAKAQATAMLPEYQKLGCKQSSETEKQSKAKAKSKKRKTAAKKQKQTTENGIKKQKN